jgi:hypothetical protein
MKILCELWCLLVASDFLSGQCLFFFFFFNEIILPFIQLCFLFIIVIEVVGS